MSRQMLNRPLVSNGCLSLLLFMSSGSLASEDWPMWRRDAGRSGAATTNLPAKLELLWERHLPEVSPAFHSPRLQFDAGYEPVVARGKLLLASSRTDSVTAYDAVDGRELWAFRTNGPVRFAPAVSGNTVCFGSDDGYMYCLELATGRLRWKHRAAPSDRRLLGNKRLISVWPIRGGPVVAEGLVYFAAGVWPFEGVFLYAMDIESGKVVWRNDRLGYLFGQQPHNTKAIGGLAPQGYLVINGDELVVPCSTAYPARIDRKSGKLIEFELPSPGRLPGGWFAQVDDKTARAIRRGKITFDDVVNRQQHEDKVVLGRGESGLSRQIHVGQKTYRFDEGFQGVAGDVHAMVAAAGRMYVVNKRGRLYCFGAKSNNTAAAKLWPQKVISLTPTPQARAMAKKMVQQVGAEQGHAVVLGLQDGELLKALLTESQFQVVAIDDDPVRVLRFRGLLAAAGLYGERVSLIQADPTSVALPKYLASLLTTETPNRLKDVWPKHLPSLRPFGGLAATRLPPNKSTAESLGLAGLEVNNFQQLEEGGEVLVRREGPLPGAAQYEGNYALSEDELVRFPLGVLWFDDTLQHFKRSPQPEFVGGVMISRPKNWRAPRMKGNYSVDYPLLPPVLSDIYTGRVLTAGEQKQLRAKLPSKGLSTAQQSYYHAPHQKTALSPKPPVVGERLNPLTGLREPRAFPKMYGCDGGVDYGRFYTLRSGTAAFYDKTLESGTVFLSGPRSGCTNSIIPSGGVLNVPYFYEGCTCSYPLPTALSLVAMPESHEQWSAWGECSLPNNSVQRIGINFGAPGDRVTRDGTLWLDYPPVGGPSPDIMLSTNPAKPRYHYRHSLWMKDGQGWPWVAASCVEGLDLITMRNLKPGLYRVRLVFAELAIESPGKRVQTIRLQEREVLPQFDIAASAQGAMKGLVREFENVMVGGDGQLAVRLSPVRGETLISGLEIIRQESIVE